MKLHYYPETDSLYVEFKAGPGAEIPVCTGMTGGGHGPDGGGTVGCVGSGMVGGRDSRLHGNDGWGARTGRVGDAGRTVGGTGRTGGGAFALSSVIPAKAGI